MTVFNELDASLAHVGERAGFGLIPREGKSLFRVADDADVSDLLSHLQCMLRGMKQIAEDAVGSENIGPDVAWLLAGLMEQAGAIAEELEVPLRSVQRAK
ncbi:hypothetical protein [Dyella telluris]|uniref:Uncharacterized protein n=1 Tax=Dyella telluris TaxID=2763498 RepID=A0A7G8Q2H8_9GAMM|nr:hypothetical protein [Dyella telluris]QNK00986.1 hypothetical protein H8F01_18235 [Dyella telluris]